MSRKIIILCLALNLPVQVFAQVDYPAIQNIRKGNWDKAYAQLRKAMRRDTVNIALSYGWATYFFSSDNPSFHLDSANLFARKAHRDLLNIPLRERGKAKRFSSDSLLLTRFTQQIDSVAFSRAKGLNTTPAYQHFVEYYSNASQYNMAISLRDESAFTDAESANTYEAYQRFMVSYPKAVRVTEARQKYETLLFESLTRNRRLIDYEKYIKENPHGYCISAAEKQIFEIMTADGSPRSFRQYLNGTPTNYSRRAQDILFHLPDGKNQRTPGNWGDSLNVLLQQPVNFVVPFLKNDKFGFMDQAGRTVIAPEEVQIDESYLCGNNTDDFIMLSEKVVAPNGSVIYARHAEEVDEIGAGFLLVEAGGCSKVIHKSGFSIGEDCVTGAKLINGCFLALQKSGKWSLYTLTGRLLLHQTWDLITSIHNVIVFVRDGKYELLTPQRIAQLADGDLADPGNTIIDDLSGWSGSRIWTRQDSIECVFNNALDTLVIVKNKSLSPALFGMIAKSADGFQLINSKGDSSAVFENVRVKGQWTAIKQRGSWYMYSPSNHTLKSYAFDSVTFKEDFAVGLKKDSTEIFFSRSSIKLKGKTQTHVIAGRDSTFFIMIDHNGKKSLYDKDGRKLFAVPYDKIQYAGNGYFTVYRKGKMGMLSSTGQLIVPAEMDAIGTMHDQSISILKDARFGLVNTNTNKMIPPQYAKNVTDYSAKAVIIFKNGLYGLSGWDNKPISKVEFSEIRYWNDTAALVRNDTKWMIYDIKHNNIVVDRINHFKFVKDDAEEKLAIMQVDRLFGVVNSRKGTILPFLFSDIVNVGSAHEPLYFTEKHVEEAAVYVVTYYDGTGRQLRKEVYDQDDYERIYCPNN